MMLLKSFPELCLGLSVGIRFIQLMLCNPDLPPFQIRCGWLKTVLLTASALCLSSGRALDASPAPSTSSFQQELGFRLTDDEWKEAYFLVKDPEGQIYRIGPHSVAKWDPTGAFHEEQNGTSAESDADAEAWDWRFMGSNKFHEAAKRAPFESNTVARFWDWRYTGAQPEKKQQNDILDALRLFFGVDTYSDHRRPRQTVMAWPEWNIEEADWRVKSVKLPFDLRGVNGVLWAEPGLVYFYGYFGLWKWDGGKQPDSWERIWDRGAVNQVAYDLNGSLVLAGRLGLWRMQEGEWTQFWAEDKLGRQWGNRYALGVCLDIYNHLWIATKAGWARQEFDGSWRFWTGQEGLPTTRGIGLHAADDGSIWFGADMGYVRYDINLEDKEGANPWAYRQGKRWGPAHRDEVETMQIDTSGTAIALMRHEGYEEGMAGLGVIARVPMTFQEKAAFYEREIDRYIKRTPWGYTAESKLAVPGDRSHVTYQDSDNDGLWTAMYGASQCFAYGATGSESARRNAEQAFRALEHLQQAPVGSSHEPPTGYVARTVRPVEWPDPNEGRLERDRRTREEDEYLWKVYEPRWPLTADGWWYWKSDTSSDELDGHYFFYPLYYDLVAKTEEQKEDARAIVRLLTDHLIKNGYQLVDHDGTVTRWGIYDPESLNHDFNWWNERGLKSLSILSYLAVAHHMTGDEKYNEARDHLIDVHGFDTNAMVAKIQMGFGSGNQSDDEMAIMCFYNLLKYSDDADLKQKIQFSFYRYCAYAAHGFETTYTNPWGTYPLDPWKGWLSDSVETLEGFPLDRVNWKTLNSHRLDVVGLPPQQSMDSYEPEWQEKNPRRGYRVDGKVLPVAERHFNHWNTDPWRMDYSGSGDVLASGTVYLLPYYMGVYYGWIH